MFVLFSSCSDKSNDKNSQGASAKSTSTRAKENKSQVKESDKNSDDAAAEGDDEMFGDADDATNSSKNKSSTITSTSTKTSGATSVSSSKSPIPSIGTATATGTGTASQVVDPQIMRLACDSGLTAQQIVALTQLDAPPPGSGLSAAQFADVKAALTGVTEQQIQAVLDTCPP